MARAVRELGTARAGLTFRERMSGPFAMGVADPSEGARIGRRTKWRLTMYAEIAIDDVGAFVGDPRRWAPLAGELELPGVARRISFQGGSFHLFPPDGFSDRTLIVYECGFSDGGSVYRLVGEKEAGKRRLRAWSDVTTLRVRLYRGANTSGEVIGAGVLRIRMSDLPSMATSVRTPNAGSPIAAARAVGSYARLFARELIAAYRTRSP